MSINNSNIEKIKSDLEDLVDEVVGLQYFTCEMDEEIDYLACFESYYITIPKILKNITDYTEDRGRGEKGKKYELLLKDENVYKYVEKRLAEELKDIIKENEGVYLRSTEENIPENKEELEKIVSETLNKIVSKCNNMTKEEKLECISNKYEDSIFPDDNDYVIDRLTEELRKVVEKIREENS